MAKVITFSTKFPAYHPKSGEPTFFVEKVIEGFVQLGDIEITDEQLALTKQVNAIAPKWHTVRAGKRFKAGDFFSPRIWGNDVNPKSGKSGPYHSKQIIIGPDIQIVKTWDFSMAPAAWWDECQYSSKDFVTTAENLKAIAANDGLTLTDFAQWFAGKGMMSSRRKPFDGQIICWNESINY